MYHRKHPIGMHRDLCGNCSAQDLKKLWWVWNAAQHTNIINIIKDHSQPSHSFFSPLLLAVNARTIRCKNSFFTVVIRLFNIPLICSRWISDFSIYLVEAHAFSFYLHFSVALTQFLSFVCFSIALLTCGIIWLDSCQNNFSLSPSRFYLFYSHNRWSYGILE